MIQSDYSLKLAEYARKVNPKNPGLEIYMANVPQTRGHDERLWKFVEENEGCTDEQMLLASYLMSKGKM